jgi:hypothetical protein
MKIVQFITPKNTEYGNIDAHLRFHDIAIQHCDEIVYINLSADIMTLIQNHVHQSLKCT